MIRVTPFRVLLSLLMTHLLSPQGLQVGSPVVPFCPFSFWVPLFTPSSRNKGTLIIRGLLGNLDGAWGL